MVRRKVLIDATCQLCGLDLESTLHALWSYPKLNVVWALYFGSLRDDAKECSTFRDLFQVCLEKGHPTDLLAMLSSHVWLKRNKLRLGETVADLRLMNSLARDALLEFKQAHIIEPSPPSAHRQIKWEPPPPDWVKINFDDAVFHESGKASLGTIIRNDQGLVMAALTQIIPLPTLVEMVEVLATWQTLFFAKELGFDQVILEGDSETAIRAMKLETYSAACFGHILSNIKALSPHFRKLVFRHTCRQGNNVVHSLARAACNFYLLCTWIEEVPVSYVDIYLAETINTT